MVFAGPPEVCSEAPPETAPVAPPKAFSNEPMPPVAAQMTVAVTMHSVTTVSAIVLRGGGTVSSGDCWDGAAAGGVARERWGDAGVGGAAYSYRCW